MKKSTRITIILSLLLAFNFVLISSCKKHNEENNNSTPLQNNNIIFNSNLNYGTLTDIDSNVYKTITIGTQTWMAENLKVSKYKDGTPIQNVTDNSDWNNLTTGAFCWYNNDSANFEYPFGKLYNWHVVNTSNICPTDWHVPSDSEWVTLINYLGIDSVAGGKLKETGHTHWEVPNYGATNESGFTALPGGGRYNIGIFFCNTHFCNFWSSSNNLNIYFILYNLNNLDGKISWKSENSKNYGYSIRCIKD